MKRKILYGMIVLLGASLLFLACDTGTNGDTIVPVPPDPNAITDPPSGAQVQALADKLGNGAVVVGSTVKLPNAVTIAEPFTIPAGIKLEVADELTVTAAGSVTNSGTITVKDGGTVKGSASIGGTGTITVEAGGEVYTDDGGTDLFIGALADGTGIYQLDAAAKVSYSGTDLLVIDGDVTCTDDGGTFDTLTIKAGTFTISAAPGELKVTDVTVAAGNSLEVEGTLTVTGTIDGTITVPTGGKVYTGVNGAVFFIGGAADGAIFELDAGAEVSYSSTEFVIKSGSVTFTGDDSNALDTLTIDAGNSLTIDAASELVVTNVDVKNGGSIVGGAYTTSLITVTTAITFANDADNNFYDVQSTKSSPPSGNYEWNTDIDGLGGDGWLITP